MIAVILGGVLIAIVFFIIGGVCSSPSDDFSLASYERERRVRAETELAIAAEELRRGCIEYRGRRLPYKCPTCSPHYRCLIYNDHVCERPVGQTIAYAKTPNEQEIVDLLTKATRPLDELKEKLGVK